MWECKDCGKMFQLPYTERLCSFCGSMNIVEVGKSAFDFALDSFGITEQDYEEVGIGIPEHQNCPCINKVEFTPLSFDDMEINEMCLLDLGLPKRYSTSLEDPVPAISYYRDMNSRFLHTFLGEPVWA